MTKNVTASSVTILIHPLPKLPTGTTQGQHTPSDYHSWVDFSNLTSVIDKLYAEFIINYYRHKSFLKVRINTKMFLIVSKQTAAVATTPKLPYTAIIAKMAVHNIF
jgi:hypothetical protein